MISETFNNCNNLHGSILNKSARNNSSKPSVCGARGGGEGEAAAPPERGTIFRLLVCERVGICLVKVSERGGKSVRHFDR